MLKIALPTFKNDENHTQNSKIHIQNSGYEVRCDECGGGFLYFGCQCGGWWCGNSELVVDFGGLLCENGCLVVWLRVVRVWFLYDCGAIAAFGNL